MAGWGASSWKGSGGGQKWDKSGGQKWETSAVTNPKWEKTAATPKGGHEWEHGASAGGSASSSWKGKGTGKSSWSSQQDAAKGGKSGGKGGKEGITSSPSNSKVVFKVSTVTKKNDVAAVTLLGDYEEKGSNHGKKYYQKIGSIPGHPNVKVLLYYWDSRDGEDFSGWWFGDQLGGTQVWARAASHSAVPPKTGWRLPWDAPSPQQGALLVDPVGATGAPAAAASIIPAPGLAPAQRLIKARDDVASAETVTNSAVSASTKLLANESAPQSAFVANAESLQKHQAKLSDLHSSLTRDIAESGKMGPAAVPVVADFVKLIPRLKALQTSVGAVLAKLKLRQTKAGGEQQKKETVEQQKKQEETDSKAFQQLLPKLKSSVSAIEAAVDALLKKAAPMVQTGEAPEPDVEEVEKAATDAERKVMEARNELTNKIIPVVKSYAPEARKAAMSELHALQSKLTDAQRKASPYKNFKKGFESFREAHKAAAEISEKIDGAEAEIAKAEKLLKPLKDMTEEDIAAVDALLSPARLALSGTLSLINEKSKVAGRSKGKGKAKDGKDKGKAGHKAENTALDAEFSHLRSRVSDLQSKLNSVWDTMKGRRQEISMEKSVALGQEKLAAAEAALSAMQLAEMPFLKGLEVLPKEESDTALADSDAAASKAYQAITSTRHFLTTRMAEMKDCANKVLAKSVAEEFPSHLSRLDIIDAKLQKFRKDTTERKVAAALSDLIQPVDEAENKVNSLQQLVKPLLGNLEEESVEHINEAIEQCKASEREAIDCLMQAKRGIERKQNEFKSKDGASGFTKINTRLSGLSNDLASHKKVVEGAQKLVQAKTTLDQEGKKLQAAEADVEKALSLAPGEDAEFTEESVKAMDSASASALQMLKGLPSVVQPLLAAATGSTKAALQKLLDDTKEAQDKLNKLKSSTKTKREKVLVRIFLNDGDEKVKAVEACGTKMSDAELPFLKGIEVLPLEETQSTIEASERTIQETHEAISQAKSFMASATMEAKAFAKDATQEVTTAFADFNNRITVTKQKLSSFTKDTAERKKGCQVQEAGEKVTEAEAAAQRTLAATEPFLKEGAEKMSEQEAAAPLKEYLEVEKAAKATLAETKAFVLERQRVSKDNAAHMEIVKKLLDRLTEAQAVMTKAKAPTVVHEQRSLATRLLEECREQIATLEGEVKEATAACSRLLEHGGEEFLVHASIRTLSNALAAHMKEKNLELKELFKEVGKGKPVKAEAFEKYLQALPEAIGRDEISFTEERRRAIARFLDEDKDGAIDEAEFGGIFRMRCAVRKPLPLTEGFSLDADAKTVAMLQMNDIVETLSAPKTDADGLVRCVVRAKVGDEEKTGWGTLRGNKGTMFLAELTPFSTFCTDADQALQDAASNISKVASVLAAKHKEGGKAETGSELAEAREEIGKLKAKVSEASAAIDALKKSFAEGKREYDKKEKAERIAHIHARNAREAEVITSVAAPAVEEALATAKAVDDHAKPFTSLAIAEVESFATPVDVMEQVEKLAAEAAEKTDAARTLVREQLEVAKKVSPPTGASGEAKRVLSEMLLKLDTAAKSTKKELGLVRSHCAAIVDKTLDAVKQAFQKEVQAADGDAEKLFKTLSKGKAEVSVDAFTKKLLGFGALGIKPEHAKLLSKRLAGIDGNVSRAAFLTLAQRYTIVVKETALTSDFDVGITKTLRKCDKDEILEVLEGPSKDDTLGVERVRVKSLSDGKMGWVTVKGNQGTCFLSDQPKPFYKLHAETTLEKSASDCDIIQPLAAQEIVELIEGPQKQVFASITFTRVKATKDGAIGWALTKDHREVEYIAPDAKLYTCKSVVAITDGPDVKESKIVRKLAVGEVFEAIGEIEVDPTGVNRVKGKTQKDEKEGWITLKGSANTVFAELDAKNYVVVKAVDLQKRFGFAAAGEVLRKLEEGEALQVLEGPKEEKGAERIRVKVRAQSGAAEGWITKDQKVRSWVQRC